MKIATLRCDVQRPRKRETKPGLAWTAKCISLCVTMALHRDRPTRKALASILFLLAVPSAGTLAVAQELHTFTRIQLSDQFWSEGATYGDLNNDRVNDIISGPWWWEGPDFKTRHEYYPATTTFQLKLGPMTSVTVPGFEGTLGKDNKVLEQLLCVCLRLQQGQLERHSDHRLSRPGHVMVREPEGQGDPLDAPQDLRPDRQRVADLY